MKMYTKVLVMLMVLTAVFLVACGGEEESTPVPPTAVPPTTVPTDIPPTESPTEVPATEVPPTAIPATEVPATAVPEPDTALTTHENVAGGYTIEYPEDWFTNELLGMGIFTSSGVAVDEMEDMSTLDSAIVIVMSGAMAEINGDDPFEMLDQAIVEFEMEEGMEIVDGPDAITVNGNDGAILSVTGDADGTQIYATIATLTNGVNNIVVMAIAPAVDEEKYAPTFNAMVNSIEISEDEIANPLDDVAQPTIEGDVTYTETIEGVVADNEIVTHAFDGVAGTIVNVIVRATDDNLDVVVDIVDADDNSIIGGEVDEYSDVEEILGVVIPADGTYYIHIRDYNDVGGTYELIYSEIGGTDATAPSENDGNTSTGNNGNSNQNTGDLLSAANAMRNNMQSFGGMIDNAVNTGFIDCQQLVDTHNAVVFAPTFTVTDANLVNAYGSYLAAITHFTNGTRDLVGNCLSETDGEIPAQQWALARQTVGEAENILQPAILTLGGN